MVVSVVNYKPNECVTFNKPCENCGVTLEYVKNDITQRVQTDYGGGSDTHYEICCPACLYLNDVKQRPLIDNPFDWKEYNRKKALMTKRKNRS